ncbi:MAG: transposase [Enterovibrio sp.]
METALTLKGVFKQPLRALQGFLDSIFAFASRSNHRRTAALASAPKRLISRSDCPAAARRSHVIDPTGLKVFGEGEWKARKHGQQKRRVWRKLHLAVDPSTHEVVSAP